MPFKKYLEVIGSRFRAQKRGQGWCTQSIHISPPPFLSFPWQISKIATVPTAQEHRLKILLCLSLQDSTIKLLNLTDEVKQISFFLKLNNNFNNYRANINSGNIREANAKFKACQN